MKELNLKRRCRVKSREAKQILAWMDDEFGIQFDEKPAVEAGSLDGEKAYIMKNRIVAVDMKGRLMLTLHGVLALKPEKRWITVDMGAVKFLANGADVMAPGIVDADPEIEPEDMVWVRDEAFRGRPDLERRTIDLPCSGGYHPPDS